MLEVKELFAGYGSTSAKGYADVIRGIGFNAEKGESLCILGPNGSGKSTLLKSITRIIDYRGAVLLDGIDISTLQRRELAKKIALLSQTADVYFPYTVYETVSMGRYAWLNGFLKNLSADDREIIQDLMVKLDLWKIKDQMIDTLSGGTLQRVFLARTLAQTPDVILLDEPASHLDLKYQIELLDFLKTWVSKYSKILIGVFHDLNLAKHFASKAIILDEGKIAACGNINEVLKSDTLNKVFGINIHSFMIESYSSWVLK